MRVPLFDMQAETATRRPAIDAAIARVLDSGVFIGGDEVTSFELELAAATSVRHAIGVSSGTDALLATLMALGIGRGDEVITTPLTFFATAAAALRLGARVVFADIDESLTLDPAAAAAAITARTKAIVPVSLYGHPARAPHVSASVAIIEDAAQRLANSPLIGRAATLSFFPTKNVGAIGDAGAVLTNDDELADTVRLLRTQGARPKYNHLIVGGNFRLDAIQAAVLRASLPALVDNNAARRQHATRYHHAFRNSPLRVPPTPPEASAHVFHQYVVQTPARDALRAHLTAAGIGTEIYYPSPLHLQPAIADLGYREGSMPKAERACQELLALPIYPRLAPNQQDYVIETVLGFFNAT